jgi:hypothetical protein
MEMDYSDDGKERFYDLIDGQREEISFMKISDEEKSRLYFIVEETIGRYEKGREDYFKKQMQLLQLNEAEENLAELNQKNINLLRDISSKLEKDVLSNAQKALLNIKKPTSELES